VPSSSPTWLEDEGRSKFFWQNFRRYAICVAGA
jgi:hypothetical protein